MSADDPTRPATPAGQTSPTWSLQQEVPEVSRDEPSLLPELVSSLDREVTRQGITTIEHYGQLLGKERDAQTQPLVEQYLKRRLAQHLQHQEDVVNEGIHRMINPTSTIEEENHGQEK